ncbi:MULTISPECIES: hypothetical protein [Paenibacillus]|uniref:hypothetical protein n=1 Tax=Paenibacillus TaxID=44249 RepID=UPI00096DE909|nr:hypothetical protein [Paenibacillus odorifer]OME61825.1 hypothetical protein BSK61_01835 [Paenibacillus odorifer]
MKLVKTVSTLTLALIASTSIYTTSSFAAETSTNQVEQSATTSVTSSDTTFVKTVTADEIESIKEEAALTQNINQPNFNENSNNSLGIFSYTEGFTFTMDGWASGTQKRTNGEITFTSNSDVYATIHQRTSFPTEAVPIISYELISKSSGKSAGVRNVSWPYAESSPYTIGWSNVLPGTYYLLITNLGPNQIFGGGFLNAY